MSQIYQLDENFAPIPVEGKVWNKQRQEWYDEPVFIWPDGEPRIVTEWDHEKMIPKTFARVGHYLEVRLANKKSGE